MRQPKTIVAVALLALGACAVGPDYEAPSTTTPSDWTEKQSPLDPATSRVVPGAAPAIEWWKTFKDAELTSLVERAAADNLDLKIAEARLREARGLRGVTAGAMLPTVNAGAGYARS